MAFFAAMGGDADLMNVSLTQLMSFTRILAVLKDDILLPQPISVSVDEPPHLLPPTIATFVSDATGIKPESIPKCWHLLKEEIWSSPRPELSADEEELFRKHGWKSGISAYHPCKKMMC